MVRTTPLASQINAGNLLMLRAPWNKAFTDEERMSPSASTKSRRTRLRGRSISWCIRRGEYSPDRSKLQLKGVTVASDC